MKLKDTLGNVLFALDSAKTILQLVLAAREEAKSLSGANLSRANLSGANLSRADLSGANLSRANLSRADLSRADLSGANLSGANLSRADLSGADLYGADLYGADLYGADLYGADLRGSKIDCFLSAHSSGYPYQGWAVLFQDGSRWIRMGCLWKTLEDWDAITIRKSNISEFPDDGSEKSECRADLFGLLRSALLRMKLTANPPAEKQSGMSAQKS